MANIWLRINGSRFAGTACMLLLTGNLFFIIMHYMRACGTADLFPYPSYGAMFIALWCYFYKQRAAALILLSITLFLYILHHHS